MPIGQVMVLGHDFDTEAGYQRSLAQRGENLKSPTWRNLLWLLNQVNVSPSACFFTNVYMGLRAGDSKVTGRFPGARSPRFVQQCQAFLAYQIAVQRPCVILTLGRYIPAVIAPLSADLAGWARCTSFRMLDEQAQSLIPGVKFGGSVPVKATVVGLTHPSIWYRCVLGRCYGALRGKEAELQMLKDAIEVAGIPRCST
jgi:uracil-DNA glycosylase